MNSIGRLRSNLRLVGLDDNRIALACGEEPLLVFPVDYAADLEHLVKNLDGTRTVEDILISSDPLRTQRSRELLAFLVEEGVVALDDDQPGSSIEGFLDTTIGQEQRKSSGKPPVTIIGESDLSLTVTELLVNSGYQTQQKGSEVGDSPLAFCDCNAVGLTEARRLNDNANNRRINVLYSYRPTLFESIVGPLVVPGVTPCFECFVGRWVSNSNHIAARDASGETEPFTLSYPPAMLYAVASLSVLELMKHLEHFEVPSTWNGVLITDHRQGETHRHHVLRLPNCAICQHITAKPISLRKFEALSC